MGCRVGDRAGQVGRGRPCPGDRGLGQGGGGGGLVAGRVGKVIGGRAGGGVAGGG